MDNDGDVGKVETQSSCVCGNHYNILTKDGVACEIKHLILWMNGCMYVWMNEWREKQVWIDPVCVLFCMLVNTAGCCCNITR